MTEPLPAAALPGTPDEGQDPPRWVAVVLGLVIVAMLSTAGGAYGYLRYISSCADLKRATEVTIVYYPAGPNRPGKALQVSDPQKVKELLDALEVRDTRLGFYWGAGTAGSVDFKLPDKGVRCNFLSRTQLDRVNWGQITISERFVKKINERLTEAEGRPADILAPAR
jgi:hypothetical protein